MTLAMLTLAARLWLAGCWLSSRRLRELALDPTPRMTLSRLITGKAPLCGR